jgi:multiple sugar transport system ATP-binding protein
VTVGVKLELNSVTRLYGDQAVLNGVSFSVEAGEFVALVGPSGCGKSTTLRMAAGLEAPNSGSVRFDGADMAGVAPADRNIGFVFQQVALYPGSTVGENLRLPLQARGVSRADASKSARAMAQRLGIEPLFGRLVHTLSGGEQQRVAVGRALVRRPRLLLLDEPLASLDVGWKHQLRELLIDFHSRERMTVIYVTHDPLEVASLADRVLVIERGRLAQVGPLAELAANPSTLFVAQHTTWLPLNVGELTLGRCAAGWLGHLAELTVALTGTTDSLVDGQLLHYALAPSHLRVSLEHGPSPERTAEVYGVQLARVSALGRSWWCSIDNAEGPGVAVDLAGLSFFDSYGSRIALNATAIEGVENARLQRA